jgi:hypothetical protein
MLIALTVLAGSGVAAHSQEFEDTFGSTTCRENGLGGVQPVSTGGYIATGSTFFSNFCATSDIYVVKINNNGTLSWSNTYDLGGNDTATDIQECANGDFIVLGSTTGATGCNTDNIFLLRITSNGAVIWAKTYGNNLGRQGGYDVQELKIAPGAGTSVGDFIVCGRADSLAGRGYLMRTTSTGGLIWDALYTLGAPALAFSSVDESTVGADSGDIIVAGIWGSDGIIFRVNGSSGAIGAAPQGAARFGGTITGVGSTVIDEFRSVRELKVGSNAGNIVAVGDTKRKGLGADIYVTKIGADPCNGSLVDRIIGDNSGLSADTAYCVREMGSGDLILTGASDFRGAAFKADAFLTELDANTLAQAGFGIRFYGDSSYDRGYSVAEVSASFPLRSAGFVFCGFTQSPNIIGTDPQQMYVVKVDINATTPCNYLPGIRDSVPAYPDSCLTPAISHPSYPVCSVNTDSIQQWWAFQRCFALDGTCGCVARQGGPNNSNDGAAGVDNSETLELTEGMLLPYPNPVRRGSVLNLAYQLGRAGTVTISVSDVVGKVIHSSTDQYAEGRLLIPISTDGWSLGTYVVRVEANGRSATQRIVVGDR